MKAKDKNNIWHFDGYLVLLHKIGQRQTYVSFVSFSHEYVIKELQGESFERIHKQNEPNLT
jgi:hypothetical protein